jgi:protein required for attachment to host cells
MQIPHHAHVLVADGRKMLFFRNEGDADYPKLEVESHREDENPAHRDQATDQAGRAAVPAGSAGGGSMQEVDFHQQQEDSFAADAAAMLNKRALANRIDALIVVAPPKTLGELRKHYRKEVASRLAGEVAKDLTNMPVDEIEKALQAA